MFENWMMIIVVVVDHNGLYLSRDFYGSHTSYFDRTLTLVCLLILPYSVRYLHLYSPSRHQILYPSLCSPVTSHKASSLLRLPAFIYCKYLPAFLFPLRMCVCVRACKVNLFHEAESFFPPVSPFVFTSSSADFFVSEHFLNLCVWRLHPLIHRSNISISCLSFTLLHSYSLLSAEFFIPFVCSI